MFNVWSKIKELINVAHPVVLFENESNTSSDIILNDSAENYKYFEIFFKNGDGVYSSCKVCNPNGKKFEVSVCVSFESVTYHKEAIYEINSNTIGLWDGGSPYNYSLSGSGVLNTNALLNVFITKVIGFKQ